jgi:hypothetical protein
MSVEFGSAGLERLCRGHGAPILRTESAHSQRALEVFSLAGCRWPRCGRPGPTAVAVPAAAPRERRRATAGPHRVEAQKMPPLEVWDAALCDEESNVTDGDAEVLGDLLDANQCREGLSPRGAHRCPRRTLAGRCPAVMTVLLGCPA